MNPILVLALRRKPNVFLESFQATEVFTLNVNIPAIKEVTCIAFALVFCCFLHGFRSLEVPGITLLKELKTVL